MKSVLPANSLVSTLKHISDQPIFVPPPNRLLGALHRPEYERLLPWLESVSLPKNRILHEAGEAIYYAYFPNDGMASLQAITETGSTIELGTVGREGYIGSSILHQMRTGAYRVAVQMPMTALRMEAKRFLLEANHEGPFRSAVLRYAYVVETQLVQAVVCSLTHTVEQRLARRLLLMSGCLESDAFDITQDQLSLILDRHRNRISAATIALRKKGAVEIARSQLRILNRKVLETVTCECYRIVRKATELSASIQRL